MTKEVVVVIMRDGEARVCKMSENAMKALAWFIYEYDIEDCEIDVIGTENIEKCNF